MSKRSIRAALKEAAESKAKAQKTEGEMDHPGSGGEGNEGTAPPDPGSTEKKEIREPLSKKWVFTWTVDESTDMEHLEQEKMLLKIFRKYIYAFQLEQGEQNGRIHWQGYVRGKARFRFMERWRKKFEPWGSRPFTEKAMGGDMDNMYCTKDATSLGLRHTNIETVEDPLEGVTLYPWQQEIMNIIKGPYQKRIIHWYWESTGNAGKTSLASHVNLTMDRFLLLSGSAGNMKNGVVEYVKKEETPPRIIFMNLVRSMEENVSYQGIEEIKDGLFYSGKFKGGMVHMNPPHMVVFANYPPQVDRLSKDRWHIVEIKNQ